MGDTKKLNKEQIADLAAVGIKGFKTQEEARPVMIEFLAKNDVDGLDDEPFKDVLEMCNAFAAPEGDVQDAVEVEEEADDPETTEDELDELGKETGEGIEYNKQTVGTLRKIAVGRELTTKKKAEALNKAALIELLEEDDSDEDEEAVAAGWDGLSDDELAELCVERELATPKSVKKMDREEMIEELTEDGYEPAEAEEDAEEEDEETTFDDISDEDLANLCVDRELATPKSVTKLSREDMIEELIEDEFDPADWDGEKSEQPKTQAKSESAKKATKNAPKAEKPAPKKAAAPVARGGYTRFDARNVEAHEALITDFTEQFFDEDEYEITILKQGFTVRKLGTGTKVPVMNYDELKVDSDNKMFGNLYMNRFESEEDLLEHLDEEMHEYEIGMFRGESHPCIRKIGQDAVQAILESDTLEEMLNRAGANDKAITKNADKLADKTK